MFAIKKRNCVYIALFFGFLLGVHQGKIALWKDGNPNPVRIFPYRVTSLPVADQEALEKGIKIDSDSQLASLLEDYLS